MKKLGIFLFVFVIGSICFAQSGNDTQRIIGTWVGEEGRFVFNSNGTFQWDSDTGNYFISNSKLILMFDDAALVVDYYFSPNGRILVLAEPGDSEGFYFIKQ